MFFDESDTGVMSYLAHKKYLLESTKILLVLSIICMLLFVSHDFVRLASPAWHLKWPQLAPTAALKKFAR